MFFDALDAGSQRLKAIVIGNITCLIKLFVDTNIHMFGWIAYL